MPQQGDVAMSEFIRPLHRGIRSSLVLGAACAIAGGLIDTAGAVENRRDGRGGTWIDVNPGDDHRDDDRDGTWIDVNPDDDRDDDDRDDDDRDDDDRGGTWVDIDPGDDRDDDWGDPVDDDFDFEPGEIECPRGYWIEEIGDEGGRFCTDGSNGWGPFTERMTERCWRAGGGEACDSDRWAVELVYAFRGDGICPAGAYLDDETGYCAEDGNLFGPFPRQLIGVCLQAGGGRACVSSRWQYDFALSIIRQARGY
jgi:hypothetical protein